MSLLTKLLMRCCCIAPENPDCFCDWSEAGVEGLPASVTVTIDTDITFAPTGTCLSGNCFGGSNSANRSVKFLSHPPTTGTWEVPELFCGYYELLVDGEYTLQQYVGTGCGGSPTLLTAYGIQVVITKLDGTAGHTHSVHYYAAHSNGVSLSAGAVQSVFLVRHFGSYPHAVPCLSIGSAASSCGGDHSIRNDINRPINTCCLSGGRAYKFLASGGSGTLSVVVS